MSRFGRKVGVHRKIEFVCKHCGKSFKDWGKRIFCSRKCKDASAKGKPCFEVTDEERERRRQRMLGKNNPMWRGGDSDKERRNSTYKNWRIKVFERDDFTCRYCGYRNGNGTKRRDLHAHHIIRWVESIEFRYEVDNGITLCVPCHRKEHTNLD